MLCLFKRVHYLWTIFMMKAVNPPKKRPLDVYHNKKNVCPDTFPCPGCQQSMTSQQFEKHTKACLGIDPETSCVWCLGKTSWPSRQKGKNVDHLMECWERFLRPPPPPPESPDADFIFPNDNLFENPLPTHQSFDLEDPHDMLCPEKELFGRTKLPHLPPDLYDQLPFPILEHCQPDLFQNRHLNVAAGCVQTFRQLKGTHDFFHCMVRAVAVPQFLKVMQGNKRVRALPFSSWCDGGTYAELQHRHHWHLLLVYPKNRFHKELWGKIKIQAKDKPREPDGKRVKNFHCILKRVITKPMHFVNALGYVSQQKSRCQGSLDEPGRKQRRLRANHFNIYMSLPKHFKRCLVLLWEDGLLDLMTQLYRYKKPIDLARTPYKRVDGRWKVKIKHLPGIPLKDVVPVAKHLRPTAYPTDDSVTLHLIGGEKLHFERDDSLVALDTQAWGQVQADGGNLFYAAVGDQYWTPCAFQQKCLNAIQYFKLENQDLRQALQSERSDWTAERDRLTHDLDAARLEMASMKEALEKVSQEWAKKVEAFEKVSQEWATLKEAFEKVSQEWATSKEAFEKVSQELATLKEEKVSVQDFETMLDKVLTKKDDMSKDLEIEKLKETLLKKEAELNCLREMVKGKDTHSVTNMDEVMTIKRMTKIEPVKEKRLSLNEMLQNLAEELRRRVEEAKFEELQMESKKKRVI